MKEVIFLEVFFYPSFFTASSNYSLGNYSPYKLISTQHGFYWEVEIMQWVFYPRPFSSLACPGSAGFSSSKPRSDLSDSIRQRKCLKVRLGGDTGCVGKSGSPTRDTFHLLPYCSAWFGESGRLVRPGETISSTWTMFYHRNSAARAAVTLDLGNVVFQPRRSASSGGKFEMAETK